MNNQILESVHRGIKPGRTRCKQCGVLKNNKTSFTHHHKRVDKDGYRAKNSTTCKSCANHNKRVISELYKKHGKDKPKLGSPCPICTRNVGKYDTHTSRWCLDHHHETNEFRGWICSKCNNAIGRIDDNNPETILRLYKYLIGE